jgi:protein-disulfide isomerase
MNISRERAAEKIPGAERAGILNPWRDKMKSFASFVLAIICIIAPFSSSAKELPKIAVWDLTSGDIKEAYAQDLTLILVSEISKLGLYEVYSQENVRTLAGWTEERLKLGCSNTQCLTALGQMDIAKLISGRIGKIGDRYTLSLNLFDTQNARSEKAVSEFCRSENELIELMQVSLRKLLGAEVPSSTAERKEPVVKEKRSAEPAGKQESRDAEFATIPLKNALVMGNSAAPLKVAVFTDPDCSYCATLHQEMEKVVQVRKDVGFYIILFPLSIHKDAYWKSKSILCNKSLKMLEDAFAGKKIPKTECDLKDIDEALKLGEPLGIKGVPAMVFPDGRVRAGSMPARQIIELIDEK